MKKIAVLCPDPDDRGLAGLFAAVGIIADAHFTMVQASTEGRFDGYVITVADKGSVETARQLDRPTLLLLSAESCADLSPSSRVDFSRHPEVPFPFSGRTLDCAEAEGRRLLPVWAREGAALASAAGVPFWAALRSGGSKIFATSVQPVSLDANEALFDHFSPDRFLGLLPLLAFVRTLTEPDGWQAPAPHACFMFDDPNLHSPRYGHMDFPVLAAHARAHRYHVTSATIPIDAWFVSARAAEVFRNNTDVLSLLVHGNDHVHEELGRKLTADARQQAIGQALRRIERLEERSGVEVSRCMAPPHGACSAEMLETMAALGFESACVSRGSLRHYNQGAHWVRTLGMRPVDIIAGLPVISRFRVSRTCQKSILLAAFLRQPIIPVGHHQDVAEGPELLAELADFINDLGQVRWTNMAQIARGMYAVHRSGADLHVRMFTHNADVDIPQGVQHLTVTSPAANEMAGRLHTLVADGGAKTSAPLAAGESVTVRITGSGRVTLRIERSDQDSLHGREALRAPLAPALWPIMRRLLTEGRDRLAPVYGRRRPD